VRQKLSLTPSCLYSFYLGKWILRRDFIEDSRKAGKWLDEQFYEWNEQCMAEGISTAHLLAPSRWRRNLQQSKGPFVGWKALVAVTDAKKRAAYKMYVSLHLSFINQAGGLHGKIWTQVVSTERSVVCTHNQDRHFPIPIEEKN